MSEPVRDPQDLARMLVAREKAGDCDGMPDLNEPHAVLDCGNGQQALGREAIREFYARLVATGVKFSLGNQRPAIVNGDLALTSTRVSDGRVTTELARRQGDGTWLWVIDQPSKA